MNKINFIKKLCITWCLFFSCFYVFSMSRNSSSNKHYKSYFLLSDTFKISTQANIGGTIDTFYFSFDTNINKRILYKANEGFYIDSIIINDTLFANDSINGYTFYNIQSNQKIRVVFSPICVSINTQTNYYDSSFQIDSVFINALNCRWHFRSSANWLRLLNPFDSGSKYLKFSIQLNTDTNALRMAQIFMGNIIKPITQFIGKRFYFIYTKANDGGVYDDTLFIKKDTNFTVHFQADSGYYIDSIIINDTLFANDSINGYTFYNIQANQKIRIVFYPFCATISNNNLYYDSATHIDSFLITAPNCKWKASTNASWIRINNPNDTGTKYLKFNITANNDTVVRIAQILVGDKIKLIEQRYLPLQYKINIYEQYGQYKIYRYSLFAYEKTNKLIKIQAPSNFIIEKLWVDSFEINKDSIYNFINLQNNHDIIIGLKFIPSTRFITIQNGKISPINIQVTKGATIRFSYMPDSGYEFDYLIANGQIYIDSTINFTLKNIDSNSKLGVFFKPKYNTIRVTKTYKTNNKINYIENLIYPENQYFQGSTVSLIDTVNNVKVSIPKEFSTKILNFNVSKVNNMDTMLNFIGGNRFKREGGVFKIDLNINDSFQNSIIKEVSIPYNPAQIINPYLLEAAYYNDSLAKWISAGNIKVDTINHTIIFLTNHFSIWTTIKNYLKDETIPINLTDFDTYFRPNVDGIFFPNALPTPYNDPKKNGLISIGGNCFGFSAISLIYYIKNLKNYFGINIYNNTNRGNNENVSDYYYKYDKLYQTIFETSEDLNGIFSSTEKTYYNISNKNISFYLYSALKTHNSPIIVGFKGSGFGHAVVVYKYSRNNDGTGNFYYYDNNYPGKEFYFMHNADGTIPNNLTAFLNSNNKPFNILQIGLINLGETNVDKIYDKILKSFRPINFDITTKITNGNITPSVRLINGNNYRVTFNINSGFELDYISVNNKKIFYNPNIDSGIDLFLDKDYFINIVTTPAANQYTLTTSITNGTITPTQNLNIGTQVKITYATSSGYKITAVYVNNIKQTATGLVSVDATNGYIWVTANAHKTINVITISKTGNNNLPPIGAGLSLANLEANMVTVPGGSFTMGATSEQLVNNGDCYSVWWIPSTQQVTLSSYKICRFEVTQQLWQDVMGSNPSYFNGGSYGTNLQRPVETVSWNDCQTFIDSLNKKTGKNYRLPTEAEWEYAARGGANSTYSYIYSGGNTLNDVAWNSNNSSSQTQTVGTKQANALGLYDMSGNVWEWCNDWYGNYSNTAVTNPQGPATGSYRVIRGGSWNDDGYDNRVSIRSGNFPSYSYFYYGIRLVFSSY